MEEKRSVVDTVRVKDGGRQPMQKYAISTTNSQDNEMVRKDSEMNIIKKLIQNSDSNIVGTGVKRFKNYFKNCQPLNILSLDDLSKLDKSKFQDYHPTKDSRILQLTDSLYRVMNFNKGIKLNIRFKDKIVTNERRLNIISNEISEPIGDEDYVGMEHLHIEIFNGYKLKIETNSLTNYCDITVIKDEDTLCIDNGSMHDFNMVMHKDEEYIITQHYCRVIKTESQSTLNNCRSLDGIRLMVMNDDGNILPLIDEV